MIIKKSLRTAIGGFLLLCFSIAAFPLDFFHSHSLESACKKVEKHSTCQHKFHISKKAAFCFTCNVHFDKNFIPAYASFNLGEESVFQQFLVKASQLYDVQLPLTFLRGPPASLFFF